MPEIEADNSLRREGITDPATGLEQAEKRFKQMLHDLLPTMASESRMSPESMGMMGLLTLSLIHI